VRRLLHVFPSFEIGGAQARFARIAVGLGEAFHHTVVSLSDRNEAAALLAPGAPVDLAQAPDDKGDLLRRLKRYRRFLSLHPHDALVTYNWGAIEFALANLVHGRPHVHIEDGFGLDEANRQFRRRVWGRRLALIRSDVVVPSLTLSNIAREVWRVAPQRLHYIPNGIADWSPSPLRCEEPLPRESVKILWAGAFRAEKNPLRLLRAFAAAPPQAVLVLIGDGPERDTVLAEASRLGLEGRYRFLGRRSDVRDVMRQCDLLALSSDTEQMPLVVLEAMDAGLPVASTDVGDVRRMVAAGNAPFVTGASDAELCASITALVSDPDLRRRVGAANRAKADAVYGEAEMLEAYRLLFRPSEPQTDRPMAGGSTFDRPAEPGGAGLA
jgi:L-malate glycosyltransferase